MSPTSISGGGKLLTGGELISPASLKHQEEDLSSTNLEQRCYKTAWRQQANAWGKAAFPQAFTVGAFLDIRLPFATIEAK
jgi:hypothetical protein